MKRYGRLRRDNGAIAIEFIMALPVMAIIVTVFIQWLLLLHSQAITGFAAFCAARSAAVWLPADPSSSLLDVDLVGDGTEAMRRIQHAAAVACVPLSPRISALAGSHAGLGPNSGSIESSVGDLPDLHNAGAPFAGISSKLEQMAFADRAATVRLSLKTLATGRFGQAQAVVATVRYKQLLIVPVAAQILGHSEAPRGLTPAGGRYLEIRAAYTICLEDERHVPQDRCP